MQIESSLTRRQAIDDPRQYIREGGPIKATGHKKPRYFFLFSDVLLVCLVNSSGKKVFDDEFRMIECDCEAMSDSPSMYFL